MPRRDGTGPIGIGPHSGRAAGFCADSGMLRFVNPGLGFGNSFGRGGSPGFGRFCRTIGWTGRMGYSAYQTLEPEIETKALEDGIQYMERNLEQAKKRLAELKKGPNQAE